MLSIRRYTITYLLPLAIVLICTPVLKAQEIPTLQADTAQLEPGVLFNVLKRTSTAAVSTVSGETLYKTPVANLSNTLYGLLPGLTVAQGSGQPGYDAATLWIRGIGSYNYGDYATYVDGFQVPFSYFQNLSPTELESVSILKDAASLAPLGMKGANGALWVETKKGAIGKPRIQLQARTGFQQPMHLTKPLQSYDYARLYNEAVSNDQDMTWNPTYLASELEAYRNGTGINTDWYAETLREQTPFTTADATFTGGNETAQYFVMLGYLNNQGMYDVKNDETHSNAGMQQFNIRTNLDFNIYKIFDGRISIGGRTEDRRYPNYNGKNLWDNMASYPSLIYPSQNEDGTWPGTAVYPNNPLASIRELGYLSTHDRTLQANFSLKEKLDFLIPGLYLQQAVSFNTWTRGTYSKTKNYARVIDKQHQTTDQNTNLSVYDDNGTNQWNWTQFQLQAGYDKQFGVHTLQGAVNYLQYLYQVDVAQNGAAGVNTAYAYQQLGGRMRYANNNRYIAEFGFSYSGSDNYAKGNRFGFFPTLSAAWVVSEEDFLSRSKTIDFLKVRASAGKSGYDQFDAGRYLYQRYYSYNGSFATGNDAPTWQGGLGPAYTANPSIFAEESMKYNLGLETKLFQSLNITADVYLDKRSGIVSSDNRLLAVLGTPPAYVNIGKVSSRGAEFSASYSASTDRLSYWFNAMASFNQNKIDYMSEITPITQNAAKTGRPIGTYFGYEANGFYDVSDFDSNGNLISGIAVPTFGAVQPGDIRYRDVNGDKRVDEEDVVAIGNTFLPRVTYSFGAGGAFAGFDLQALFQGSGQRSVNIRDASLQTIAFRNNGNAYGIAESRWAYYPNQGIDTRATASYPRLSTLDNQNNYRNSSLWIKDGSFLRLRHVELGYTLPVHLLRPIGMDHLRVFVNGVNLVTWSPLLKKYDLDPETMNGYAAMKSINFGFTVKF